MKQEKQERIWEPTKVIEIDDKEIQLWSSHQRSHVNQCKCGIWVEDIDDHIMRKIGLK